MRNPDAPGAGEWPPELAGRDREISQFKVVLERVARGRPERSIVLTGLRGVGKTVLLNSFRSMAIQQLWGTGKIEARPDQSIRRPVASALHMAIRELAPRHRAPDRIEHFLGVLKAFAARIPRLPKGSAPLGIDVPAVRGRADSGDLETDLTELFADAASVATDLGSGSPCSSTRCRTSRPGTCRACAACHELSQTGGPLIVVGAGSAPAVRAVGQQELLRAAVQLPADRPAGPGGRDLALSHRPPRGHRVQAAALDALYRAADGYPYFVQAYGKVTWDVAAANPVTEQDVAVAAPEAESELAVGFFGSRYERATPAEREYMRAMAALGDDPCRRPGWPTSSAASRPASPRPATP